MENSMKIIKFCLNLSLNDLKTELTQLRVVKVKVARYIISQANKLLSSGAIYRMWFSMIA